MTYELALALKIAGFPQPHGGGYIARESRMFYLGEKFKGTLGSIEGMIREGGDFLDLQDDITYIPTLEELIGACYQSFWKLIRIGPDEWNAYGYAPVLKSIVSEPIEVPQGEIVSVPQDTVLDNRILVSKANDAEEAVARLYLLIKANEQPVSVTTNNLC